VPLNAVLTGGLGVKRPSASRKLCAHRFRVPTDPRHALIRNARRCR